MNQEDVFETQLVRKRAGDAKIKKPKKTKSKKTGLLKKLLKNPFARLGVFSLGEIIPLSGLLPWQTIAVYDVWKQEKKAGKSPNIAEYLTIGIPVFIVDFIGACIALTGFGILLAKAIILPCIGLIWVWRFFKHTTKSTAPSKKVRAKKKK